MRLKGIPIILKRAKPLDKAYLKALEYTLSEWSAKQNDDAFKDPQCKKS